MFLAWFKKASGCGSLSFGVRSLLFSHLIDVDWLGEQIGKAALRVEVDWEDLVIVLTRNFARNVSSQDRLSNPAL